MKIITVERCNIDKTELWHAFLGKDWKPDQPIGVGTTPNHALGSLMPSIYQALGIKLAGPEPELGDSSGVLGGMVRAYADEWGITVDIREGKDGGN